MIQENNIAKYFKLFTTISIRLLIILLVIQIELVKLGSKLGHVSITLGTRQSLASGGASVQL